MTKLYNLQKNKRKDDLSWSIIMMMMMMMIIIIIIIMTGWWLRFSHSSHFAFFEVKTQTDPVQQVVLHCITRRHVLPLSITYPVVTFGRSVQAARPMQGHGGSVTVKIACPMRAAHVSGRTRMCASRTNHGKVEQIGRGRRWKRGKVSFTKCKDGQLFSFRNRLVVLTFDRI